MIVVRKRLIFWLIKAYIKKSKKILIISFLCGLLVFFAIIFGAKYLKAIFSIHRSPVIGIVGSYQRENLPDNIQQMISRGLTKIDAQGKVSPDLAQSYSIKDNGKTYTFNLKKGIKFSDGTLLQSNNLPYNFSDVAIEKPDPQTISFKLKDQYSPFLATVSRPIFKNGLVGLGDYSIKKINLNGGFVQTITLGPNKNRFETTKFVFYPTEKSLKTAFALGEVTEASGLNTMEFENSNFNQFPKTSVKKNVDYEHLVTLFYNVEDENLSDKKLRLALNYALPENFAYGEKAYLPYPKTSMYYNPDVPARHQDFDHAKVLLGNQKLNLTITVLRKYSKTAEEIAKAWSKIGIKTKIIEVDSVPDKFQIFLSDFNMPQDPDQYVLWHSAQPNNITKYKNLRIDKLLEDGRKTVDVQERIKTYQDFQKYLLDDMPASFLYFPYSFDVSRT